MINMLSSCPVGQSCGGNDFSWIYILIAAILLVIGIVIFIIFRKKK